VEITRIQQRSKPEDSSTVLNPHWFEPPTSILYRHRRKKEEAPHLDTEDNKSKD
jgi:hypothetical protein